MKNSYSLKPILLSILAFFCFSMTAFSQTYTVNINLPLENGNDDGEEFSGGSVTLSSSDIELVEEGTSNNTVAFRFSNIPLPPNSIINSAYIQLTAEEIQTGNSNLNIQIEDAGNSSPFSSSNSNLSSRNTTTTTINWSPSAWTVIGEGDVDQQTPGLKPLLDEVLTNPNWNEGNAMTFIFTGTGTRTAYSFDQNPNLAARLIIEAEVPLPTNPIPQIYINEVVANASSHTDESEKKEDWIELYNPNNVDVNLGGLYLTDKLSSLDEWQIPLGTVIPANEYLVFFADKDLQEGPLHADFSLKAGGEDVALSQLLVSGLTIIDQVTYDDMPFLASYGRETDGGNNWVYFGEVTPSLSNNGASLFLSSPSISLVSGSYAGTQTVTLSHPDPSVSIYYTTDGAYPNTSSALYTGNSISINSTQSIRAVAVKSSYTDSHPVVETYMIDENNNLPVIYLTTDPDNFFDDEIGIYVDGTNGVIAYCATTPVNWAQDWERPTNVKMFLPNGDLAFDVNAGVDISGACSRSNAMRSLAISTRSKDYGDDAIEYPLFEEREHEDYQRIKLRNSGQDYHRLGFRDMVNQSLHFGKVDLDLQAGRPSILYLNGEFWGLYNIREKYAGEYFEAIYDLDEDDLDIIKSPGLPWQDVKKGNNIAYNALFDVVDNSDFTNNADFQYFESQVDVNEFMNYWIAMTYMANYDWPANNLTIWRDRVANGKWRYGVADTDGSTNNNLSSSADPDFNTFALINDDNSTNWPNHQNSTLFLRRALDRSSFRDEFIQRTCSFIELIYNEERTSAATNEIVDLFQPNIEEHLAKWAFDGAMGGTVAKWNEWIGLYNDFWQDRPVNMRQHINDLYGLNGDYNLTINFDANTGGDVFVNSNQMDIPFNYTGTYFKNIPLHVTAVAHAGFEFSHWLETGETNPEIDFVANVNSVLTPVFTPTNCDGSDEGQPCNDGDVCTINDIYDVNCNCSGIFEDTDNDGVCDANDQCPGFDDNIDLNNNGIPDDCEINCTDADNDGVCENEDCDDNNPTLPALIGSSCDDGNPLTENDVYLADGCTCEGVIIQTGNYCESMGTAPWQQWISNVNIGTINNDSAKESYGDFTAQSTNVNTGSNYNIDLTTAFSYFGYDMYFSVWIDYNADGDFTDEGETALQQILTNPGNGVGSATTSGTISILGNAANGATRMRISAQRDAYSTPCETFENGEVEDYTLMISGGNTAILNINCPNDVTVTAAPGATNAIATWNAATANSTCTTGSVSVNQTGGQSSGSSFNIGTHSIEYTATDGCGNTEICSFTVTVEDGGSGVLVLIACQNDITIIAAQGATSATITWNTPIASSTCEFGSVSISQTSGEANGSDFNVGTHDIEYTITDGCGNTVFCNFTLTVLPANVINYCEASASQPWQQWIDNVSLGGINNATGKTQYSDYTNLSTDVSNGDAISLSAAYSYFGYDAYWRVWIDYNQDNIFQTSEVVFENHTLAPVNGIGSDITTGTLSIPANALTGNTRMRVALRRDAFADPCGTFTYGEVEDYTVNVIGGNNAILTINCPNNLTVTAAAGATSATASWNAATANSTCTTGSVSVNQTSGEASGSNFNVGTHTIEYTSTDGCNNTEVCSFTVTILSSNATLSINCPSNVTVTAASGTTSATASWNAATANSTCTTGSVSVNQTGGLSSGSSFNIGTHTIEYTATDGCNNTEICTFVVTVLEDQTGECTVNYTTTNNSITVTGLNGTGHVIAKLFSPSWATLYNCLDNCDDPLVLSNLTAGTYHLSYNLYTSDWQPICSDLIDIPVTGGVPSIASDAEFLYFFAEKTGVSAQINWTSNTGFKNDYFELERSKNGIDFETITIITNTVEGQAPSYFNFIDFDPERGNNYYRLKQFYLDGTFRYSEVKNLLFDIDLDQISIYPNPSNYELFVDLSEFEGQQVHLASYNQIGQKMFVMEVEELAKTPLRLDLSNFNPGIYLLSIQIENLRIVTKKFIVVK